MNRITSLVPLGQKHLPKPERSVGCPRVVGIRRNGVLSFPSFEWQQFDSSPPPPSLPGWQGDRIWDSYVCRLLFGVHSPYSGFSGGKKWHRHAAHHLFLRSPTGSLELLLIRSDGDLREQKLGKQLIFFSVILTIIEFRSEHLSKGNVSQCNTNWLVKWYFSGYKIRLII